VRQLQLLPFRGSSKALSCITWRIKPPKALSTPPVRLSRANHLVTLQSKKRQAIRILPLEKWLRPNTRPNYARTSYSLAPVATVSPASSHTHTTNLQPTRQRLKRKKWLEGVTRTANLSLLQKCAHMVASATSVTSTVKLTKFIGTTTSPNSLSRSACMITLKRMSISQLWETLASANCRFSNKFTLSKRRLPKMTWVLQSVLLKEKKTVWWQHPLDHLTTPS